jgi:PAS domain S-box-containing protein
MAMSKPNNSDIGGLAVQILNIIEDPISIKNDGLQFIFVNDAFCALYDWSRETFLGRTLSEISHDAYTESAGNQEKSVLETGAERIDKFEMTDAAGNSQTLAAKRIRLGDKADGNYVLCIIRNTAEAHLFQEQKPRMVSRSRGPVTREAIHDLNNALNVVRGYSELLLEDLASDDPSRKDIEAIYQAGRHAADITSKF